MDDRKTLESELNMVSCDQYIETITYFLWGSIVTTTRAFNKVVIKIDPKSQRIFAQVILRWWAKSKRLQKFRNFWLKRAEKKAKEYVPDGWKLLVYYAR